MVDLSRRKWNRDTDGAVGAENEGRLKSVLGERRGSRRHRSQRKGDAEKDIVVGGMNE
jgi:hypothetical protein